MNICYDSFRFLLSLLFVNFVFVSCQKRDSGSQLIERKVDDLKEFKKLLRTKNNVLTLFVKNENVVGTKRLLSVFAEVAEKAYGKATLAFVNCGSEEGKKTCKKLKVLAEPYILKHYNNGDFHKDYDRSETVDSIIRFLLDPTGELPWEEEPTSTDVVHIPDAQFWMKLLRKNEKILVMFYAPWCGYCKRLKPDYAQAATELKNTAILAAADVTRAENYVIQQLYNITGFPTLLYFVDGKMKYPFAGEQTKDGLVKWMKNPTPGSDKGTVVEEVSWADEASDVVHLTDDTFEKVISENPSVLIMFYAPWCGHCKKMKPDYVEAAKQLKEQNSQAIIAAVDATKEKTVATKYDVKGFPTVKYFKEGKFAWDFNERTIEGILNFMKDPQEPPPPPPPELPWHEVESDVLHLGVENFKAELKKRKHVLAMFYAPWCGHCKLAKPEYTFAASRFKDDPKVAFAAVDCTVHNDICRQYDVQGFPTFKYFSYLKTVLDYSGGRAASDFVKFMSGVVDQSPPSIQPEDVVVEKKAEKQETKSAEPTQVDDSSMESWDSAVTQLTPNNIDATFSSVERTLVMFFAPWCRHCKEAKPEFVAAARLIKGNPNAIMAAVDCTKYEEICQDKRIMGYPSFVLFSKKGEYVGLHEGDWTSQNFVKTVNNAVQSLPPPQPPATKPDIVANTKKDGIKTEL